VDIEIERTDSPRLQLQLLQHRDHRQRGASDFGALETFASPSTGCCGMVPEATPDTIVGPGASKQSVDFLCCGLGSA
jgi:hypothetical protein